MTPEPVADSSLLSATSCRDSVTVLSTRSFRRTFFRGLSRVIEEMTVISPFVTTVPGFKTTHEFFGFLVTRMPDALFILVTKPPSDIDNNVLSHQEANLIARLGVNVVIRKSLHSKVYYLRYPEGDTSSFVGSANFTKGGFERNDETIAHWRRGHADVSMEREVARLTGRGAYSLMQWNIWNSTTGI